MRTSISSQTLNGIYKQSNKRGSKSFTIKEPLPRQKMDCLPLMTRGVLSHMQRTQKAQSGNTVAHSKEKKSVMWESVSPSFQRQNIFPLISYRIFPLMNFPVVKAILTIKKHYWDKTKTVKYQTTDGSEVSHKTYSFEAKLKDCDIPIKFVVIFGKWNKDDDNTYHILITNQLNASSKTIITNYLLRWGIEHCFKELKDTFYFDHYQVRHIEKIERYRNRSTELTTKSVPHCTDSYLLDKAERISQ